MTCYTDDAFKVKKVRSVRLLTITMVFRTYVVCSNIQIILPQYSKEENPSPLIL